MPADNEAWMITKGDEIIQKKTTYGIESLSDWDKLVYCLWVTDYSMRNAGDLQSASDVYFEYQSQGLNAAAKIGLPLAIKLFSMSETDIQHRYFDLFEAICTEVRSAKPSKK